MNSSSKIIRFLVSYELFASLLLVSLLMSAGIVLFFKLQFWDLFGLVPSRVFIVLMIMNRLGGFFYEVRDRQRLAVLSAGIIMILAGLTVNYLYRFEAIISLGEGESFTEYDSIKKGLLSKPLISDITVEKIEGDSLKSYKSVRVNVRSRGKIKILSPERSIVDLSTFISDFSLIKVELAPSFLIMNKEGKELHSAFVKLSLYPQGKEDYFSSPAAAHRFFLSLTGKEDKPLKLKILRGKLTIVNKEISFGEEIEFEGLKISFPEIRQWVIIKVVNYPGNIIMAFGIVLALAGCVFAVKKKAFDF